MSDMSDYRPYFASAALRTLSAGRWTLLKARLFGKRSYGFDGSTAVTVSEYKGIIYVLDVRITPPD